MHRKPKTTQERKANGKRGFLIWDEYRVKLRGRRSSHTLVDAWDDLMRSDINHHSWERHRRTQYKCQNLRNMNQEEI